MERDKKLERAGKKGVMAGLILGTIRRGNPASSRLARPLAYGAGGYMTGTALHLLAKRLIKPKEEGLAKTAGALYDLYSKHEKDYDHHLDEYYKLFDKDEELTDEEWDTLRAHDDAADDAFWAMHSVSEDLNAKGAPLGLKPFEDAKYGVGAAMNALKAASERNKGFPYVGVGIPLAVAGAFAEKVANNNKLALATIGAMAAGGLLSKAYTTYDMHKATKALEHANNTLNTYKSF